MDEPRVILTFGKSNVRPHVRSTNTGTVASVKRYSTRRAPGQSLVIRTPDELEGLPKHLQMKAKAGGCTKRKTDGDAYQGRARCGCPACKVWRAIKKVKDKKKQNAFHKAVSRLDSFLRRYWTRASNFFKDGSSVELRLESRVASKSAGELNKKCLDPEEESMPESTPVHVGEDLPWAAPDHASAPPIPTPDQNAEQDVLAKAYAVRDHLQQSILEMDQQLGSNLQDEQREHLLQQHLEYLIKADALSRKIEQAENVAHSDLAG